LQQGYAAVRRTHPPAARVAASSIGTVHAAPASPATPSVGRSGPQTDGPVTIDSALVKRAQAGEPAARARLCVSCVTLLAPYFRGALRNGHDADDAAQHVVVQILESLPRYRVGPVPFAAWMFTIARNHLIDRARAAQRVETLEPSAVQTAQEMRGSAPPAEERRDAIMTLIAPLPIEQQRILTLLYVHDLSPRQVGRVLGKSDASVRQIHKRARDNLREIIEMQSRGSGLAAA
jgi:RNA polymerase sigma-70 factor (ECF subfamily)